MTVRLLSGSARGDYAMRSNRGGAFEVEVEGAVAGDDYGFIPTDLPLRADPLSRWQPEGVHGPSRIVDPSAFEWHDGHWVGLPLSDYVIYELHIGTFTREGTFDAAIAHLAELEALGVTAIEVMPVAEFPGRRNWGYDGAHLYAPQSTYGGPEGLRRFVDAAHATGLAVVLDVVYNHVGPEGSLLAEIAPYVSASRTTPWGAAFNYDELGNTEVRRYVIENALYWVTEFHIDALRLDAVQGIVDRSPTHIVKELCERVHEAGSALPLPRAVHVIAESDQNDPALVRERGCGGYGLDGEWSDDYHHAAHVALTGETEGYYAGYAGVKDLARVIERRFVYEGQFSTHRGRPHGAPAADLGADKFIVYLQNHDQVGNRPHGDRLTTLVEPSAARLAAAITLFAPSVPLLFMGEEYGEIRPFLYFVSHHDSALRDAVREGRRRELRAFGWQAAPPDPDDENTFEQSILDRSLAPTPAGTERRALYRDLLALRREEPLLRPGRARLGAEWSERDRWLLVRFDAWQPGTDVRRGASENGHPRSLVALFNFARHQRDIRLPAPDDGARWVPRISTDRTGYGGALEDLAALLPDAAPQVARIPPLSAALFSASLASPGASAASGAIAANAAPAAATAASAGPAASGATSAAAHDRR